MKKGNSQAYVDTKVTCSCGNSFIVKSNKNELHLEVCSECHPYFKDGKEGTSVSRTGRVEKFNRKYGLNKEAK